MAVAMPPTAPKLDLASYQLRIDGAASKPFSKRISKAHQQGTDSGHAK
jgi:hypothetical protein